MELFFKFIGAVIFSVLWCWIVILVVIPKSIWNWSTDPILKAIEFAEEFIEDLIMFK